MPSSPGRFDGLMKPSICVTVSSFLPCSFDPGF